MPCCVVRKGFISCSCCWCCCCAAALLLLRCSLSGSSQALLQVVIKECGQLLLCQAAVAAFVNCRYPVPYLTGFSCRPVLDGLLLSICCMRGSSCSVQSCPKAADGLNAVLHQLRCPW